FARSQPPWMASSLGRLGLGVIARVLRETAAPGRSGRGRDRASARGLAAGGRHAPARPPPDQRTSRIRVSTTLPSWPRACTAWKEIRCRPAIRPVMVKDQDPQRLAEATPMTNPSSKTATCENAPAVPLKVAVVPVLSDPSGLTPSRLPTARVTLDRVEGNDPTSEGSSATDYDADERLTLPAKSVALAVTLDDRQ